MNVEADNQRGHEQPRVPRVYVASLADYNDGELVGRWIRVDQSQETIQQTIREMLRASAYPDAEEWAVHDFEGFGPLRIPESARTRTLARLGAGIAKHGLAFAHWAQHCGISCSDLIDSFEAAHQATVEINSGSVVSLMSPGDTTSTTVVWPCDRHGMLLLAVDRDRLHVFDLGRMVPGTR
jgi:antirestriction protein